MARYRLPAMYIHRAQRIRPAVTLSERVIASALLVGRGQSVREWLTDRLLPSPGPQFPSHAGTETSLAVS